MALNILNIPHSLVAKRLGLGGIIPLFYHFVKRYWKESDINISNIIKFVNRPTSGWLTFGEGETLLLAF